jgi:hypothetical protein
MIRKFVDGIFALLWQLLGSLLSKNVLLRTLLTTEILGYHFQEHVGIYSSKLSLYFHQLQPN